MRATLSTKKHTNTGKQAIPKKSSYILIASMDVDPEHEDFFNEVYDSGQLPHLLALPGVSNVTRNRVHAL